ncbi:putative phage methyltransferase protein [Burkholderia thailandensis USAMRU Malaysia |nr:putative phage methyltransferase protein [Burkholderia thailandensis USAMRU Malaysia \
MSPTTTSTIKSPRSGCATSLRQAASRPVTSTNATSATCIPTTFVHTPSAISSQASASGPTRFVAPDGPTIDLFGRVPVRANLSPRQAKDLGLMTSGISGLRGTGSSVSAVLQSSLESRLRGRLSTLGSTLFKLTWKRWTTPMGVSRFRLRASAPRTSETARTGWPTPRSADGEKNVRTLEGSLREIARRFPEHIERIAEWERLVTAVCRPRSPATFMHLSGRGGHTGAASHIWQVIEWAKTTRGGRQYDLLADAEPATACSSAYGLCE